MLKCAIVCGVLYFVAVFLQITSANDPFSFVEEPYVRFEIEGNHTAAVGSSFTVTCKSNVPNKLVRRSTRNTTISDIDVFTVEDEYGGLFIAEQILTDLTYKDVGWFDCLELSSHLENNVTFYLFVDDPAHLMLGPRVTRLFGRSDEVVVLPCLPTAPDVNVNLLSFEGIPIGYSTDPKDEDTDKFYYHPTRGFILPGKFMTDYLQFYRCEFTKRGVKQLNSFEFFLDHRVVDFTYLTNQGSSNDINAKPGTDVVLTAEIFTNFKPTVTWCDNEYNEIKTDKKHTIAHVLGEPEETRLVIHNVSSSDAGVYTVVATCSHSVQYVLHVGGVGTLEIEMDKVCLVSSDNFVAFCRETPSRPIYELTWTFRRYNCQLQNGCEERLSSLVTYRDVDDIEFNPKFPHAILFNKPMLANITCAIIYLDDFSEAEVTRPLIISEAKNGFEIEHKYDKYFNDKTVALTCTVSRFLYSDYLYWIGHDGFVIEKNRTEGLDGRNMVVTRSETDYSYRVTLTIQMDADYTPPVETYRCMAVDYQHVPSFKSHELNIKSAVAPHFFDGNMRNESLFLKDEDDLTLTCYAGGVPSPTLHWYKDDMKIGTDGHHDLELHLQMNDTGRYSCVATNDFGKYSQYTDLEVYYPVNITINDTGTADGWSLEGRVSERVILLCYDDGKSVYSFTWFRDDYRVYESSSINIRDSGTILSIFPVKAQDSGFYTCISDQLIVDDSPSIVAPVLGSIFAIVLVFAVLYLALRVRRLNTLGTPISYRNLLSKRI